MNYVMLHDTVQFYDDRHQQSGTTQHSWETLDGAQQRAHTSGVIPWWRCRRTRDKLVSCFGTSVNMYLSKCSFLFSLERWTENKNLHKPTDCMCRCSSSEWMKIRTCVRETVCRSSNSRFNTLPPRGISNKNLYWGRWPTLHPATPLCSTASLLPA